MNLIEIFREISDWAAEGEDAAERGDMEHAGLSADYIGELLEKAIPILEPSE